MPTPAEKLVESLEALHALQREGVVAIRSAQLSRTHRERLIRSGFLEPVLRGWYIPSRPDQTAGESTAWYASYWDFCVAYLVERFADDWSLSPEQSLQLHAENWRVPQQLLVRAVRPHNNVTVLPHGTSLLDTGAALPDRQDQVLKGGMRLFSLPAALIAASARYFQQHPTDARTALSLLADASPLLQRLLDGGHSTIAGRLAGAFRNIGRDAIADDIIATMTQAGYAPRESDPFATPTLCLLGQRATSPHEQRLRLLWQSQRDAVLEAFQNVPRSGLDADRYLQQVDELFVTDAYHSLSIEGYRVSTGLIERVRTGDWNPDGDAQDRSHRDALAARGYWQCFQRVKQSIVEVLAGASSGAIARRAHADWYRELFGPGVTAGMLRPSDLAGYRNGPVYIRRSRHVPPAAAAVRDAMPALFELLEAEEDAAVRAVLGHFVFVYIHPYTDGNGRIGRFLMNLMLASGGFPWTVIRVEQRQQYMDTLELASTRHDLRPFAGFVANSVRAMQP